ARRDFRARGLRRPRRLLRDLGARGARRLQERSAPARVGKGADFDAPAGRRGQMSAHSAAPPVTARHRPVLLAEVMRLLAPRDGGIYVDGTFGAGGYSRAILETADCRVWGIDRDLRAIAEGAHLAHHFADRLTLIEGRFGEMQSLLADDGLRRADGIALDLGISSMQLDEAVRGFSFRADGPLDMRMGGQGPSAADLVNESDETVLADIIYHYGEERRSRAVARAIHEARRRGRIETTAQLAELVAGVVRAEPGSHIHPATRTFQGLRIAVNDELGELVRAL